MKMTLRPRNRAKRCFELSFRYLLFDERYNDGSWSLVHGRIACLVNAAGKPCEWCGHAWLINKQGLVYDPVYDVQDPWKKYVKNIGGAAPWVTYSQKEASAMACEHLHYGPWDVRLWSNTKHAKGDTSS
jgi:hypothetical protein